MIIAYIYIEKCSADEWYILCVCVCTVWFVSEKRREEKRKQLRWEEKKSIGWSTDARAWLWEEKFLYEVMRDWSEKKESSLLPKPPSLTLSPSLFSLFSFFYIYAIFLLPTFVFVWLYITYDGVWCKIDRSFLLSKTTITRNKCSSKNEYLTFTDHLN